MYRQPRAFFIILVLSILGFFIRLVLLYDELSPLQHFLAFCANFIFVALIWIVLSYIQDFLNRVYPYERGLLKRLILQLLMGLTFMYSFLLLSFAIAEGRIPIEITKLIRIAGFLIYTVMTVMVTSILFGTYYFNEWKMTLLKSERLLKEKAVVQFDNLKNQMNPHFLFNSLTSLNSLIHENQELASQFLQQLAKVYRYVLENKDKELVSLQTEINFIRNYISLLETRFGKGLKINIELSGDVLEKEIVPVTLQVLIENAVKHNIIAENDPLIIRIYADAQYLIVENNLQKKAIVETSNKIGLDNMKVLYTYLSSLPLLIEENEQLFRIKIPLL